MNCKKCNGLSIDLENTKPYLCLYDNHWSENIEDLNKQCPKEAIQ